MSVLRPRTRIVNFRLSDEEFRTMGRVCEASGARSLSDFARTAVLTTIASLRDDESPVSGQQNPLLRLDGVVGELEDRIHQLLHLIDVLQQATPLETRNVSQGLHREPIVALD